MRRGREENFGRDARWLPYPKDAFATYANFVILGTGPGGPWHGSE